MSARVSRRNTGVGRDTAPQAGGGSTVDAMPSPTRSASLMFMPLGRPPKWTRDESPGAPAARFVITLWLKMTVHTTFVNGTFLGLRREKWVFRQGSNGRLWPASAGTRYPSDVTDAESGLVEPLIPPGKRGGGKRTAPRTRHFSLALLKKIHAGPDWICSADPRFCAPRLEVRRVFKKRDASRNKVEFGSCMAKTHFFELNFKAAISLLS